MSIADFVQPSRRLDGLIVYAKRAGRAIIIVGTIGAVVAIGADLLPTHIPGAPPHTDTSETRPGPSFVVGQPVSPTVLGPLTILPPK